MHEIVVQPYVLPNQAQFSSLSAFDRASGPNRWNRQQGFYIYRENRMIQSGGWNRLRTQDEHTKLARVSVDIPRSADTLFKINVPKMRVTLADAIRDEMKTIAAQAAAEAQVAYRAGRPASRGRASRRAPAAGNGQSGDPVGASPTTHVGGTGPDPSGAPDLWPEVERILRRELQGRADLLARLMESLRPVLTGERVGGSG